MDHREVGRFWNANARAWTRLSRAGYDTYRDHLNTPAFLDLLPGVAGQRGLDIGCGEGYNARLLAQRGVRLAAIDIASIFASHAHRAELQEPVGIGYSVASAVDLPFPDGAFDFTTAFMSFMDIPETGFVIAEAYRVLKPGGFLQFSISHPCFDTPHRRNLRDERGNTCAIEVGDYFQNLEGDVSEWIFSAAPEKETVGLPLFKTPRFTRTLSQWLNLLLDTGFSLERIGEPRPSDALVQEHPNLQDAQVVAYFLRVCARKPGLGGYHAASPPDPLGG